MRKREMARIPDVGGRKTTFFKRKKGLTKKLHELTTLCGIQACGIILSPFQSEPEFWPSKSGAEEVVSRFRTTPSTFQNKKMSNLTYLDERVTKMTKKTEKKAAVNRDVEVRVILGGYLEGTMPWFVDGKKYGDLESHIDKLYQKVIRRQVALGGESSPSYFPGGGFAGASSIPTGGFMDLASGGGGFGGASTGGRAGGFGKLGQRSGGFRSLDPPGSFYGAAGLGFGGFGGQTSGGGFGGLGAQSSGFGGLGGQSSDGGFGDFGGQSSGFGGLGGQSSDGGFGGFGGQSSGFGGLGGQSCDGGFGGFGGQSSGFGGLVGQSSDGGFGGFGGQSSDGGFSSFGSQTSVGSFDGFGSQSSAFGGNTGTTGNPSNLFTQIGAFGAAPSGLYDQNKQEELIQYGAHTNLYDHNQHGRDIFMDGSLNYYNIEQLPFADLAINSHMPSSSTGV